MYSRWFNVTVVILWLATMCWLVQDKVLPLLAIGDPPSLPEIVDSQADDPPVGWEILIDDQPLGWALTETKKRDSGMREIRGRVHVDEFPLERIVPGWLHPFSQLVGRSVDQLRIDARSVLRVDALGHLLCFESSLRLDPPDEVIGMSGIVERGRLRIVVRASGISITREFSFPSNALPGDFFSPQSRLPGLHDGQTWSVPIYSPLWPSKKPLKIIHAAVEGLEPMSYGGAIENVWLVVYRNDTGGADDDERNRLGRLWVRRDGTVLRQQSRFSNSTVTFVRMTRRRTAKLVESADKRWWAPANEPSIDYHD